MSIYRSTAKSVLFLAQMAGTRSVYYYIIQSADSSGNFQLAAVYSLRLDPVAKDEKMKK